MKKLSLVLVCDLIRSNEAFGLKCQISLSIKQYCEMQNGAIMAKRSRNS